MNPEKRATPSQNTRLQAAAWLAFLSWGAILGFFVGIPLTYWLRGSVPWPLAAGAACLALIVVLMYFVVAQAEKCHVCGAPVFGGGTGHRKHPNARKFLGISYSRQVAWEILTAPGYHCMHCQTLCRTRRSKAEILPVATHGLPESVFQPSPAVTTHANSAPGGAPVFAPAMAAAAPSPFTMVRPHPTPVPQPVPSQMASPLQQPSPSAPSPDIAHPERPPWAHHPQHSPFVVQTPPNSNNQAIHSFHSDAMKVPNANDSTHSLPAFPEEAPFASAERTVAPPSAPQGQRSVVLPGPTGNSSPFMPMGAALATSSPPNASQPIHATAPMMQEGPTPAALAEAARRAAQFAASQAPAAPAAPSQAPAPNSQQKTAPCEPNFHQFMELFAKALTDTRRTVDGAFENLLGQLKSGVAAMTQPTPAAARPQHPETAAPKHSNGAAPMPPPTAAETASALAQSSAMKAPDPQRAAQLNAVLAQAFAQQQRQQIAPQTIPMPQTPTAAPAPTAMPQPAEIPGFSPFQQVQAAQPMPAARPSITVAAQTPPVGVSMPMPQQQQTAQHMPPQVAPQMIPQMPPQMPQFSAQQAPQPPVMALPAMQQPAMMPQPTAMPQQVRPAVGPQSPFTLVTPMAEMERPVHPANQAPEMQPAPISQGIPQPPQRPQFPNHGAATGASQAMAAASPFAAVTALPELAQPHPQASPFQTVSPAQFTGAPFAPTPGAHVAPFSFLSNDGDSFVPDPSKAPTWVPPGAQQPPPPAQPLPAMPDMLPPWAQPSQS